MPAAASIGRLGRAWTRLPRIRMRVLRRLRAGLPDRDADRKSRCIEIGQPEHSVVTTCAYCGVGCTFKAEMRGEEVVRMVPVQGRQGQPRPFLRQGPLRLGLRHPQGAHPEPDDPRQDHRSVARSVLGRGDRYAASEFKRIQAEIRHATAIGGITSSRCTNEETYPGAEADPRRLRQQQRRHLRPRLPFADRLRPRQTFGTSAGTQDFDSVEDTDVMMVIGANPTDGASGVRLAHEEAAARRARS